MPVLLLRPASGCAGDEKPVRHGALQPQREQPAWPHRPPRQAPAGGSGRARHSERRSSPDAPVRGGQRVTCPLPWTRQPPQEATSENRAAHVNSRAPQLTERCRHSAMMYSLRGPAVLSLSLPAKRHSSTCFPAWRFTVHETEKLHSRENYCIKCICAHHRAVIGEPIGNHHMVAKRNKGKPISLTCNTSFAHLLDTKWSYETPCNVIIPMEIFPRGLLKIVRYFLTKSHAGTGALIESSASLQPTWTVPRINGKSCTCGAVRSKPDILCLSLFKNLALSFFVGR